jgi:hypothetical protein
MFFDSEQDSGQFQTHTAEKQKSNRDPTADENVST